MDERENEIPMNKIRVCRRRDDAFVVTNVSYIAPEVLMSVGYDSKADVWSAGVVLFSLACGRCPFEVKEERYHAEHLGTSDDNIFKRILRGAWRFTLAEINSVPQLLQSIITEMLRPEPTERPDRTAVLAHAFFSGVPENVPRKAKSSDMTDRGVKLEDKLDDDNLLPNIFMNEGQDAKVVCQADEFVTLGLWNQKYGFGYQTSNGGIGCLFNDNSAVYLEPSARLYAYVDDVCGMESCGAADTMCGAQTSLEDRVAKRWKIVQHLRRNFEVGNHVPTPSYRRMQVVLGAYPRNSKLLFQTG